MRILLSIVIALGTFVGTARAADKVDFAKQIQPIFVAKCAKCHGEEKALGKLRLHTAEAIGANEDKQLIIAEKPDESEVVQRISLPADDKKRMPKGGDPLAKEEIDLIRAWIEQGAVMTAATDAKPMEEQPAAAAEVPPPPELEGVEEAKPETIAKVEQAGGLVMPLYAGSPLLSVSFPTGRENVNDETTAVLVDLAPQLVWLDLGRTKVTDAGLENVGKLKNLERLHLELTDTTDAGVAKLAGLSRLTYLNLYGTKVTDKVFDDLKELAHLEKLFLWQAPVSYDAAKTFAASLPGREVNLGWDHPGVVKERLTKELERVTKQKEESTKRAADLEKELAAAKAEQESATKREEEIKKELDGLDKPKQEATTEEKTEEKKS